MASKKEIADYITGQIGACGDTVARKMFGEYGLYYKGKIVALIADDQLFVKPTEAGIKYLEDVEYAPPYPGAREYLLIPEDMWENAERLTKLIQITATELPEPKMKKAR